MKRREFCGWVGLGSLVSVTPITLLSCSEQATPPTSQEFRAIGTVADLDQKGFLLNQQDTAAPVLIVRDPNNPQQLLAVNPTCTHKGCTVEWKAATKNLVCPCHDATFAPDGKVVKEPADTPLKTYTAKIEAGTIFVA